MKRRTFAHAIACGMLLASVGWPAMSFAADEAPEVFIKRLSDEVMRDIKADKAIHAGDTSKVLSYVDQKIMPNVDFRRMTAAVVGPAWRQASPQQQQKLMELFKVVLVRAYAGGLSQVDDQTISIKPMRSAPTDDDVVVRTEIRGRGNPIELDYRLEKTPGEGSGWKIYNLNVLGVWMVETFRTQYQPEVNTKGIDGLIAALEEQSRQPANTAPDKKG